MNYLTLYCDLSSSDLLMTDGNETATQAFRKEKHRGRASKIEDLNK